MVHKIGTETLKRISEMKHYPAQIFSRINKFVGQRILEIGCGIGTMTNFFAGRELVIGIDIDADQLRMTRERFKNRKNLKFIKQDILKLEPAKYKKHKFDTIICINLLEHIRDDAAALKKFHDLLVPGGKLIIQVPAMQSLYSSLDKNLEHYRRYSRKELIGKASEAGFKSIYWAYINFAGIFGWFVNGKILRKKILPAGQLKGFDALLPAARLMDIPFRKVAGLGLVYIGEKQ